MPISGFNITSDDYVAPSPNSPDGVIQNQEFELPNVENRETSQTLHKTELPETTRTYVELTQDPNVVYNYFIIWQENDSMMKYLRTF